MTALPAWIDKEAWQGFCDMRRAIKKPMTPRAETLILKTLYTLKEKGHDPNACLDQSTLCNWQDIWPVKDKEIPNMNRTYTNGQKDEMTDAERVAANEARVKAMSAFKLVRSA